MSKSPGPLDAAPNFGDPVKMQRARGEASLTVTRRGVQTVLADLRQDGCLKIRFPRGDGFQAVLLNTSGGVAGADRLRVAVTMRAMAAATVTTQAAERFYRARSNDAASSVQAHLVLEAGAQLHWLPQEAIFFNGCAVDRRLNVTMEADSAFLGLEALVFGRTAMGEQLRHAGIAETIRVERAGRLILHDAIRLSGPVADLLARPAIGAGAAAVATLIHVAPDAAERLDLLRDALGSAPVEAGASCWDGMLVARLLARDGACLRAGILAGLGVLRSAPLPRMWLS